VVKISKKGFASVLEYPVPRVHICFTYPDLNIPSHHHTCYPHLSLLMVMCTAEDRRIAGEDKERREKREEEEEKKNVEE
jgi:hypothetical protein